MLMGQRTILALILGLNAFSCSNGLEDVTTRCKTNGKCGGVTKVQKEEPLPLSLASNVALSRGERAALFKGEFIQFRLLTETFCKKAYETRALCPASSLLVAPLAPSEDLACNFDDGTKVRDGEFALLAEAYSGSKPVKLSLVANKGLITSTGVSGGLFQKISWTHQPGQKGFARFVDLARLELKDDEGIFGNSFSADKISKFELRIEGKPVLQTGTLTSKVANGLIEINMAGMFTLKDTPACAISQKYLDDSEVKAKDTFLAMPATERFEGLSETEAKLKLETLEVNLPKVKQQKAYAMDSLGVNHIGCWQDTSLKNLKIIVEGGPGAEGGRRVIDGDADNPRQPQGNQLSYTFQLSDSLRVNANNANPGLFNATPGKIEKNDFSGETTQIGSLRFLKIRRNGYTFESPTHNHCYGGFLGAMQSCYLHFRNDEVGITKLNKLKIFVNDQLAYERSNIDHTFHKDSLEFLDINFSSNSAWRALSARSDCKVTNETPVSVVAPPASP